MKLITLIKVVITLTFISMIISEEVPTYEAPTIYRKDAAPFNQPHNARIDNMNDTSENNYKRYKGRQEKNKLNRDLDRNFDLIALRSWMDFYEKENLDELAYKELIENLTNFISKSVVIQNYVHFKSNMINKKLALLDMKLKQIDVLNQAMENIKNHPGNPSTNLGNNLLWKDSMNDFIRNSAVVNSLYSTAASRVCDVLGIKDRVLSPPLDSRMVEKSHYKNQYSPRDTLEFDVVNEEQPKPDFKDIDKSIPLRNLDDLKKGKEALQKEKEEGNKKKDSNDEKKEEKKEEKKSRYEDENFMEIKHKKSHRKGKKTHRKGF